MPRAGQDAPSRWPSPSGPPACGQVRRPRTALRRRSRARTCVPAATSMTSPGGPRRLGQPHPRVPDRRHRDDRPATRRPLAPGSGAPVAAPVRRPRPTLVQPGEDTELLPDPSPDAVPATDRHPSDRAANQAHRPPPGGTIPLVAPPAILRRRGPMRPAEDDEARRGYRLVEVIGRSPTATSTSPNSTGRRPGAGGDPGPERRLGRLGRLEEDHEEARLVARPTRPSRRPGPPGPRNRRTIVTDLVPGADLDHVLAALELAGERFPARAAFELGPRWPTPSTRLRPGGRRAPRWA